MYRFQRITFYNRHNQHQNTPMQHKRKLEMIKILIIDPDNNSYKIFKKKISLQNYEIFWASDGANALEFIENHSLDLVVVDLNVAYVTGLEIIDLLHKWNALRPWIIATCLQNDPFTDYPKLDLAASIGADEILAKPYRMEQLLDLFPSDFIQAIKQDVDSSENYEHKQRGVLQAGLTL